MQEGHLLFSSAVHFSMSSCRSMLLVLTKRPQQMRVFLEMSGWNFDKLPDNIYLGVTAENQQRADERIPILQQIPATKSFVSIEPMLGPVNLKIQPCWQCNSLNPQIEWPCLICHGKRFAYPDWVIAGCESGPNRRQAKTQWFRDLKNQCVDAGIPYVIDIILEKDTDCSMGVAIDAIREFE